MFIFIVNDNVASESRGYDFNTFITERSSLIGKHIILKGYFRRLSSLYLFENEESANRSNIIERSVRLEDTTEGAEIMYSACNNNQVKIQGVVKLDKRFDIYYISEINKIRLITGEICYKAHKHKS